MLNCNMKIACEHRKRSDGDNYGKNETTLCFKYEEKTITVCEENGKKMASRGFLDAIYTEAVGLVSDADQLMATSKDMKG
jgi:hypothetical protein